MFNFPRNLSWQFALTLFLFSLVSHSFAAYDPNATMSKVSNGEVEIAYLDVGEKNADPILVIMGLAASHRIWNPEIINGLLKGGYRVVLLDNRDVGESSRITPRGKLWLAWQLFKYRIGWRVNSPYTLSDMARDATLVLDALEIDQAHLIGASMGGMIAQIIAYEYPTRTASLVSIMSTTWASHLPQPGQEQQQGIADMNESSDEETQRLQKLGFYPDALPNQVTAILNAGDRTDQVATIDVPTLVLHGAEDQLLTVEHGEHTAKTIPGAKFKVYQNMGHNFPKKILPELIDDMLQHFIAHPL